MEQLHRETKYPVKTLDEKLIWIIRDVARQAILKEGTPMLTLPSDRWKLISSLLAGPIFSEIYLPIPPVLNVMHCLKALEDERSMDIENSASSVFTPRPKLDLKRKRATCTSSTTASTIEEVVDAASSKKPRLNIFDIIRSKFQKPTSYSSISSVSSFITTEKGGTSLMCTLETPMPGFLIQLRCWRTAAIEGISDIEKLKHAYASIHLYTDKSPIHSILEDLMVAATDKVMSKGGRFFEKK
jgi:hypothetical protein